MKTARRRFLQTVAGTASLGLVDVSWLRGLASFGAEPPPDKVQFSPDLEPLVPAMYAAVYESIAAHSRLGLNVVSDFGPHGAIHPRRKPGISGQMTQTLVMSGG